MVLGDERGCGGVPVVSARWIGAWVVLGGCPTPLPTTSIDTAGDPLTSEETFIHDYADAWCSYWRTCDEAAFVQRYEDIADCVVDKRKELSAGPAPESCDYDPDAAEACIEATVALLDCDDATAGDKGADEACAAVYTGCDTG